MKLHSRLVEKPWGRTRLPDMFGVTDGRRIGEVWFEGAPDAALLSKYLFTSERLSIQVHPDDAQAQARGLAGGKAECWYILDAGPDAVIGLGLAEELSAERFREAAGDGSIERLMDWRPVRAGDFYYVPPGTVHAIGPDIALLEFQQNRDVTYRLYDYGRPRELHLDDAIAVARPAPYPETLASTVPAEPAVLLEGPHFCLVQGISDRAPAHALAGRRRWVMPLEGEARSGTESAGAGECLLLEPGAPLDFADARILIGAEGRL